MRKTLATIGVVSALLLAGCSTQQSAQSAPADSGNTGGFFVEKYQKLSDGRTVMCLYKEKHSGNGFGNTMSCDWDNAIVHK